MQRREKAKETEKTGELVNYNLSLPAIAHRKRPRRGSSEKEG